MTKSKVISGFIILILCISTSGLSFGQKVSSEVISTAGEHFSKANGKLSWTLGEVMTETYSVGNNKLTQGFHQTKISVTAIDEIQNSSIKFQVYPNPTSSAIIIEATELKEKVVLELYDMNGKILQNETMDANTSNKSVNLANYSNGNYLLLLKTTNNQSIKSLKISKQ